MDCCSSVADEGGFQVVAKTNIAFDTILCYVVGKDRIYEIAEDEPTLQALPTMYLEPYTLTHH